MPAHRHIFQKYHTSVFIETGSYKGEGIQCALDSNYDLIRSVEIDKDRYDDCRSKFENNPKVQLYLGSTEERLWDMIQDINTQATFWLDAHWSGPGEPMSDQKCPLENELNTISMHPIKNHIIMIDDMRCCNTDYFEYKSKELIEQAVLKINPNYKIVYEHSWEPNDILVAYL